MPTIADRLRALQRDLFVGREPELKRFRQALADPDRLDSLLWLHGIGGVGKTMLLERYRQIVEETPGGTALLLDVRELLPTPAGFIAALARRLNLPETMDDDSATLQAAVLTALAERAARGPTVLLLDTYEEWVHLDRWLRAEFFAFGDSRLLVVVAGREPPRGGWVDDPAWRQLVRQVPLHDFSREQARAYLRRQGLSDELLIADVQRFTRNHPLALALAADMAARLRLTDFRQAPERHRVLRQLIRRLLRDTDDAELHELLEACALLRHFDEELLAALLERPQLGTAFDRLCQLGIVYPTDVGLTVHDLVRESLASDLKWRQSGRYEQLRRRALAAYQQRIGQTPPERRPALWADMLFLCESAVIRDHFFASADEPYVVREVSPADLPAILDMRAHYLRRSFPEASWPAEERELRGLFAACPEAFRVAQDSLGQFQGYSLAVPITAASLPLLRQGAATGPVLRAWSPAISVNEALPTYFFRYADFYPAAGLMAVGALLRDVLRLITPGRRMLGASPFAFEQAFMRSLGFVALERPTYTAYGLPNWRGYLLDLSAIDFDRWVESVLFQVEPPAVTFVRRATPDELREEVKRALGRLNRPDLLAASPLAELRAVSARAQGSGPEARGRALAALLKATLEHLASSPKDADLARLLAATYVQRQGTPDQLAQRFNLSPATCFRWLRRGHDRLAELLRQQEAGEEAGLLAPRLG